MFLSMVVYDKGRTEEQVLSGPEKWLNVKVILTANVPSDSNNPNE